MGKVLPQITDGVLGPTTVTHLDNVGSGNATAAHVLDNGRIGFMFRAFEVGPRGERNQLVQRAERTGAGGLAADQPADNARTIDGLATPLTGVARR